jgi:hypothetical protein
VSNGRFPGVKLEVVGKVYGKWRSPGVKLKVVGKVGG